MANQIFVNVHVADLPKSRAFYETLGFSINEQFSDDTAACVVISDHIFVMLLTHDKFSQFTSKEISDAHKSAEVLNALSIDSKEEVNRIADAAVNAGGTEGKSQDHGFMYSRSFADLDGHIWELVWMDMSAMG
ncbi:MAG: glyoxalase/bleomycin resistance/extradiol dioxygenase family protein [Balneolaceae bacterium]|nr:glyoxalase/bleomycin resistance/extradiol dioxygenase family protein [Balneolaceae bacterium]